MKRLTLKFNSQKDREQTTRRQYGLGIACMLERRTEEGFTWGLWVKGSVCQKRVSVGQMLRRASCQQGGGQTEGAAQAEGQYVQGRGLAVCLMGLG